MNACKRPLALTAWPVIVGWDIWAGHKPFVSAAAIFATFITGSMSLVAMAEYLPGVTWVNDPTGKVFGPGA